MSSFLRPHGLYSPWNSPGQNTGVGSLSFLQGIFPTQGSNPCLLHCRQILYQLSHKRSPCVCSVAQSFPTLYGPMGCNPPGSSVHGIFQARILEWVALVFQGIFPIQRSNPRLLSVLYWQEDFFITSGFPGGFPGGTSDKKILLPIL